MADTAESTGPDMSSVSRRRVVASSFVAATVGGVWVTGLSVLARGHRPQILVVGTGAWQMIVVESVLARMLILSGEFEFFPDTSMRRMLGILRPRVDLLAGQQAALDLASTQSMRRLANPVRMVLDRSTAQGDPNLTVGIDTGLTVTLGALRIQFSPVVQKEWSTDPLPRSWFAELTSGDLTIAVGPSLDLLGRYASARTTLAIAPSGRLASLHRMLPQATVVTNATSANMDGFIAAGRTTGTGALQLVRTFANDVATLEFRNGGIRLPSWTESFVLEEA